MRKYSLTVSYRLRFSLSTPASTVAGRHPQALIVMAQSAGISSRIFRATRAQMVQALRSVQWASANKWSQATIFANPIYRGVKVFNRETRVEGEHRRKRRRNPQQDVVTSEVEAIVPEQLWSRVQEMLTRRRANRLPVRRYAGGYAQSGSGSLWHPRAQLLSGALEHLFYSCAYAVDATRAACFPQGQERGARGYRALERQVTRSGQPTL